MIILEFNEKCDYFEKHQYLFVILKNLPTQLSGTSI